MEELTDEIILNDLKLKLEKLILSKHGIDQQIERTKKGIEIYSNGKITFPIKEVETENNILANIEYEVDLSVKDKVILALKSSNTALTTKDIREFIKSKEPNIDEEKLYNDVSGVVFNLTKQGSLKKYKPSKMKGQYYASPTWYDNTGNLLELYKPKNTGKELW